MFEHVIGKQSNRVLNVVERGAVKTFAEAIGDPHPIYTDREFAQKTRYQDNIAPPTFPRVFEYGTVEALTLPEAGLIHGEQTFTYQRPLIVEEPLYCYTEVENYVEKQAQSGKLGFLTMKYAGEDESGKEVFTSRSVIVITEAVRKGMQHA
ncbi:MaoC family dehydratase N-terminal domain-containing protein [Tuberibacillus sp. Marseille-P3662]|uniref:MaoC family dehydratase N-terminal domain-containing protein n=1 Tax=Tuberibacillus sp. Marseille-P3662 TaxID=1965358 RepID=UPI000A1C82D8|nr:MaoC family dehydratase N-terminal domain-containing protein [Tuberibacillus sp. Marseille-P3662]